MSAAEMFVRRRSADPHSSEEHAREAELLLDGVNRMVFESCYGWDSAAATNMLWAAEIHIRIAELKKDN